MQCLLSCLGCCTHSPEEQFKLAKRYLDASNSSCTCCCNTKAFKEKGFRLLIESAERGHEPAWLEIARTIPTINPDYWSLNRSGFENICRRSIMHLSTTGGKELEVAKCVLQRMEVFRRMRQQQEEQESLERLRQFEQAEQRERIQLEFKRLFHKKRS